MPLPELTQLARELESSDSSDRNSQQTALARLKELRGVVRTDHSAELARCLGAVVQLIEALTGSRETIGRDQVKGIACRMLYALGSDMGALTLGEEGAASEAPRVKHFNRQNPGAKAPDAAASNATSEGPAPANGSASPASPGTTANARPTGAAAAQGQAPVPRPAAAAPVPKKVVKPAPRPLAPQQPKRPDMAFGRMLVELGHVTRKQVAAALRFHRAKGPRIGECLLLQGAIAPEQLLNALKIQELLRTTPQGITTESLARYKKEDEGSEKETRAARQQQQAQRPPDAAQRVTEGIFLGEVLLGAAFINNDQLEKAMRMHHQTGMRVGEALIEIGAVTEDDIDAGLELQERLRRIAGNRA